RLPRCDRESKQWVAGRKRTQSYLDRKLRGLAESASAYAPNGGDYGERGCREVVKTADIRKTRGTHAAGFTLSELSISVAIFSIVSIGLLMGFTSLERSYAATTAYTINHADQLRISDYLAVELRRAVAVQAAQNDTSIYIPTYYDANGAVQTPTLDG